MQHTQPITYFRPFLTAIVKDKQRIVFDNIILPTPDYFNTRYAADCIQLPIADYIGIKWGAVVRTLQL
jgi:hypothetical protein